MPTRRSPRLEYALSVRSRFQLGELARGEPEREINGATLREAARRKAGRGVMGRRLLILDRAHTCTAFRARPRPWAVPRQKPRKSAAPYRANPSRKPSRDDSRAYHGASRKCSTAAERGRPGRPEGFRTTSRASFGARDPSRRRRNLICDNRRAESQRRALDDRGQTGYKRGTHVGWRSARRRPLGEYNESGPKLGLSRPEGSVFMPGQAPPPGPPPALSKRAGQSRP